MSKFTELQSRHEKLIQAQPAQDIQEQVQQYIEDVKLNSSQIPAPHERDQLRANLRYWASYIYDKTGTYPNIELAPAEIPAQSRPGFMTAAGIIAAALTLAALVYLGLVRAGQEKRQTAVATQASSTQQAAVATLASGTQQVLSTQAVSTIKADLTQTAAVYPTLTSTPLPEEITPTLEPTQVGAISIQITSVQNDDRVLPVTVLSGNYSNLPAGYSIHLIIQPLSKGGIFYPMKKYATVSANYSSGDWSIEGRFGQEADLKKSENYKISMVAAIDDQARSRLAEAVDTGFQKLPDGVIQFPQSIIVSRGAYSAVINGIQVIYSSYLDNEGNYEIFSMNPDGTDEHRITFTSGKDETFPSISPDGKQIAYVGRGSGKGDSIEIINSDNTFEIIVPPEGNLFYERPLWSSDGLFIAYAVGTPQQKNRTSLWSIFVYDMKSKKSFEVAKGTTDKRYLSWIPKTHDIVLDANIGDTNTSGFFRVNIMIPNQYTTYYDGLGEEVQPAISPDGTHLAYMQVDSLQLDNSVLNIYVLDMSTGKITQLTNGDLNRAPVWNPDGKTIYFESTRYSDFNEDGHLCIWSINADGTNLTPLTKGKDRYPFAGYMVALISSQP